MIILQVTFLCAAELVVAVCQIEICVSISGLFFSAAYHWYGGIEPELAGESGRSENGTRRCVEERTTFCHIDPSEGGRSVRPNAVFSDKHNQDVIFADWLIRPANSGDW